MPNYLKMPKKSQVLALSFAKTRATLFSVAFAIVREFW